MIIFLSCLIVLMLIISVAIAYRFTQCRKKTKEDLKKFFDNNDQEIKLILTKKIFSSYGKKDEYAELTDPLAKLEYLFELFRQARRYFTKNDIVDYRSQVMVEINSYIIHIDFLLSLRIFLEIDQRRVFSVIELLLRDIMEKTNQINAG